ncbi:glycosyltransferase family 2 protein [Palleronia sediminis]|uniref:Glycosyltransferase family 2 protein n=1 Tax=Palleronia sediminis TaxID=2547833 RepID=A0A4R6A668_9RHOB|nr:glycosyltransferase family 2 protein [Palleronia sediminis]TDL78187.1 glycosyltransferase family 2 protein [Palleronia sediminis]
MSAFKAIRLGLRRRRWYYRAIRKRRDLTRVKQRTRKIRPGDTLVMSTLRNERIRLPFFLAYYRGIGVDHFLFVDNGSTDGSAEYLAGQPDCSVWRTEASYRRSRFGVDWLNWLGRRYCCGHWVLCVDVDEFFVYPFCDTRPLRALTDWLDATEIRSFGAMLLDMYPKGDLAQAAYSEGQNPIEIASWFDAGNYTISRNWDYSSLWIQGGPRARVFFADRPKLAPALNKVPLVKWRRGVVFASSTHMLLPRGLNLVFDDQGGEKACGVLLHAKFLDVFAGRADEEAARAEHYGEGREYKAYADRMAERPQFWCKWSERYINWRQLEILGLMSKGNWA